MSRSGYIDVDDAWEHIRWRGAVKAAFRGKRGQTFLREMLAAMDALPEKKLIRGVLVDQDGCACALGTVALARGTNVSEVDPEDYCEVASVLGVAEAFVCEIIFENDECGRYDETPEQRYTRMRRWIVGALIERDAT